MTRALPWLFLLSLSGCATRIIDFTALSTKNVDIVGEKGGRVTGEDKASLILFIPTGQPNIKQAIDNALENGRGDLLLDGVIYSDFWWIPYIYGRFGYRVEGTVVNTRKRASPPPSERRQAREVLPPPEAPTPSDEVSTPPPPAPQAEPAEVVAPPKPKPSPKSEAELDSQL